jgi:hypothetical protein
MRVRYAEDGNYTIDVDEGIVDVHVWRRPDVAMPVGAGFAQEKVAHLTALAPRADVVGLLLNLADAPTVIGPLTQQAVQAMLRCFVDRGRRVVIVVGESSMQRMQCQRLLRELGQPEECACSTVHEAREALRA